jgi:hypothetical protein
MMDMDNMSPSDRWRYDSEDWVDADNAANILEGMHSIVFARKVKELLATDPKMPVNRAENEVKASVWWEEWVKTEIEARKEAHLKKIKAEHSKMKYYEKQSQEANERAEFKMTMGGG